MGVAGTFKECIRVIETSPLKRDAIIIAKRQPWVEACQFGRLPVFSICYYELKSGAIGLVEAGLKEM